VQINSIREKKGLLPLTEVPEEYRRSIDVNKLSKEEKKHFDCKLLNINPIQSYLLKKPEYQKKLKLKYFENNIINILNKSKEGLMR